MAYMIQTKQIQDGAWLSHGARIRTLATAKKQADEGHAQYFCPKRVIDADSQEVIYTVGDTPEHEAHCAKVRATVAAQAWDGGAVRFLAVPRYVFDRDASPSHQDLVTVALVHGPRDGVSIVSREGRTASVISTELYTLC